MRIDCEVRYICSGRCYVITNRHDSTVSNIKFPLIGCIVSLVGLHIKYCCIAFIRKYCEFRMRTTVTCIMKMTTSRT